MEDQKENPPILEVGQEYESIKQFEASLRKYEATNFCLYNRRRSTPYEADEKLAFSFIRYECIHFGAKRPNPNLTGDRPMQKSYKIGCKSYLELKLIKTGKCLVVDVFHIVHNHPCTKVTYDGYPKVRKMQMATIKCVQDFNKVKAKPLLIKPLIKAREGDKIVLSRDISNVRTNQIRNDRKGRSEEEMLLAKLQEIKDKDPEASTVLDYNKDTKKVNFLLIQTSEMRKALHKFPEVILMDISYKINKNMMPVSVIQVMNGEGKGEAVCYAFLANERKETLTNMLLAFCVQSGQEIFEKTNCIVVDKDFSEIGAIRAVMPNAKVHICSVHVEKNMKKAAKGDPNKGAAIESFKGMMYAEDDPEFQVHFVQFNKVASKTLNQYFVNNWLLSKEAWSLKDRIVVNTLRNHTTNRVENANKNLKVVMDVNTTLYDAVDGLIVYILGSRRDDARYRDHEALTKIVTINKCSDPVISQICNELTIFSAKLVCEQYELSKKPSPDPDRYQATKKSCTCAFLKIWGITCRHIMRFRKDSGIAQYDLELIPKRWRKEFNLSHSNVAGPARIEVAEGNSILKPRMPAKRVSDFLGPREKFLKAAELTQSINPLLVDVGTKIHYERYQLLTDLCEAWKAGTEVQLLHQNKPHSHKDVIEDGDTSETAPFKLNSVKIVGHPKGIGETVHDGTKKKGTSKAKAKVKAQINEAGKTQCCCSCGLEAGEHFCIHCKKVVHAIEPCSVAAPNAPENYGQPRICADCGGLEDDVASTKSSNGSVLSTMLTVPSGVPSGNPRTESNSGSQAGSDEETLETNQGRTLQRYNCCCSCGMEMEGHHCSLCDELVHDVEPCSYKDFHPDRFNSEGRLCAGCEGRGDLKPFTKSLPDNVSEIIIISDSEPEIENGNDNKQQAIEADLFADEEWSGVGFDLSEFLYLNKDGETDTVQNVSETEPVDESNIEATNSNQQTRTEVTNGGSTNNPRNSENYGDTAFVLDVVQTKGRPKTTTRKTVRSWNFTAVADKPEDMCCICEKSGAAEKCQKCQSTVHSSLPCSLDDKGPEKGRICNFCCDYRITDAERKSKDPKKPPYYCFGCNYLMKMFIAKNPKQPSRKGAAYYGCLKKLTEECKPFKFWASKQDTNQDSKMGSPSKRRANGDNNVNYITPTKRSRHGRVLHKKKVFTP
ncbi:uncharacterized protein LOC113207704 [Frankliniella occidentalis]|uniref:Uncharacterized protein LOC113207704 n=1 Tax=Frankliniella occidentalis TaxID=133901 RepID=A0A6J1SGL2_FRAOC|nr:uncharacterized protein LOC113207704 [Frankliniella occidentalis]